MKINSAPRRWIMQSRQWRRSAHFVVVVAMSCAALGCIGTQPRYIVGGSIEGTATPRQVLDFYLAALCKGEVDKLIVLSPPDALIYLILETMPCSDWQIILDRNEIACRLVVKYEADLTSVNGHCGYILYTLYDELHPDEIYSVQLHESYDGRLCVIIPLHRDDGGVS